MSDEELAVKQEETPAVEADLSDEEALMAELKEAITVKNEEVGALRRKLTISVPQEIIGERRGKEFLDLKRQADVPGFRKGHAPLKLVEKRFGADVGDQLVNQLVSSSYLAAIEKEDVKALGDPMFWIDVKEERVGDDGKPRTVEVPKLLSLTDALDHLKMPDEGELTFSCELEVKPDFELPELAGIPIKRAKLAIEDEDVDREVDRLRMYRGTFQPVEKGGVKADDMLYVDMKMSVGGEVIETEENVDIAARGIVLKGVPLEGLGEALAGKKIGELVSVEGAVPDDHTNIDLRGKQAEFEFKINEIKRLKLPTIDKEFLEGSGFESEKELRTTIRTALESRLEEAHRSAAHDQIGEYLINETKLEIPEGLSQRQADRSLDRARIKMLQSGVPEVEVAKRLDERRSDARDQVVRDLKLFFILEKIAEDKNIDVPEERLNAAIAQIAQRSNKRFDRARDELSKGDGLTTLYLQIRDEMLLEGLLQDAEISDEKVSPKKTVAKKKSAKAAPAKSDEKAVKKKAPAKAEKKTAEKKAPKKAAKKAKKTTAKKKASK